MSNAVITLPLEFRDRVVKLGVDVPEVDPTLDRPIFQIDLRLCDSVQINKIYDMLKPYPSSRTARIQINAFMKEDGDAAANKASRFNALHRELMIYLATDATRGWVYETHDNPIAYLITGADYEPPVKKRDYEKDEYITVWGQQNRNGRVQSKSWRIYGEKCTENTPAGILRQMGLRKETDEMHALYDEEVARYRDIWPRYGQQLVLKQSVTADVDDGDDDDSWYRHRRKKTIDLSREGLGKVIHDSKQERGEISISHWQQASPNEPDLASDLEVYIAKYCKDKKAFKKSPYDMSLKVFHLEKHIELTVHVRDVKVYEYDKMIRNNLILPGMYNLVLDVLTHDMDFVGEDSIKGKSGGNCILLAGPPGLGKTLTAEVYAEFRQVPLYKIHSGQLGTNAKEIENNLLNIYKRASGWGVPVLLDEFDVFGRARGDNLEQNAVVAVFLRTLEYQANTIFLTTNKSKDMDDAILSRCAAIINFEYPSPLELHQIWLTLRKVILPKLPASVVDELMVYFKENNKQMSGRDVKNILNLAARYANAGKEVTKEVLITCAGFRGI